MKLRKVWAFFLALCLLSPAAALSDNTLVLSGESFASLDALESRIREAGDYPFVDLTDVKLSTDERLALMEAFPDVQFLWNLKVCGVSCTGAQMALDLKKEAPGDYREFIKLLRCMPRLESVDLYRHYVSRANMALLTETFPNIRFGFTFRLSDYTIRTDATAFSTLKDGSPPYLSSEAVKVFKYCHNLLALDLGHNALTNLDFLYDMPQLKVLILACNRFTDITPIASLKNLEYLEIFKNDVSDLSPLSGLTNLIDLNVSNLKITDVTALYGLTNLERLWLSLNKKVPAEQYAALREALPNAEIVTDGSSSTDMGWRKHARYKIIYRMFNYGSYLPWDAPPLGS